MSMFKWSNPDSSVGPNNSTTLPFGFSAETTTGVAIADPVNASLAASSPFSRATTLSACLQIEWLGKLSDIQGQVAIVQNYPLSAFASNIGALGTAPTPPSVDQIFNYAATRERFSAAGHEVIWRPTNEQVVPRTAGDELYGTATKGQYKADTCFWVGETTTGTATWLSCPNPNEVYGIAIAYKGMAAGSNVQIQVNAIKTVALELSARNNQIEIPPQPEPAKMFNVDVNAMTNALSVENDMWQLGRKALSYVGIDDVSTAFGTAALTGAVYSGPTALQALSSGMRMLGMGSRTRGRLPSIH